MNKILVEIRLPASGERFDVYIPNDIMMYDAVKLIANMITELSGGTYKAKEDAILCDAESGAIFDVNLPVAESGICNGSKLMLV